MIIGLPFGNDLKTFNNSQRNEAYFVASSLICCYDVETELRLGYRVCI
jgi:hypothetical protein